jgi:hypothetical protein
MKPILSLMEKIILLIIAMQLFSPSTLYAEDPKPTREAFINEVLDEKPTKVTPKFNDYMPSSYHIEKEDLFKGLTEEAKKRKLNLRAVSIIGPLPADPLWTSYVVVFIQKGEKIQVNSLVMPHARITGKASGMIPSEKYQKWLAGVGGTAALQMVVPPANVGKAIKGPNPFDSEFLLVTWSEDGKSQEFHHGNGSQDKKFEKLFEKYNEVLKDLKKTYPEKE